MVRFGETHTKEQIWEQIQSGHAQLWPTPKAAVLTRIDVHPSGLKEFLIWLGGGDLNEIKDWEPIMVEWAKQQGCSRMIMWARKGWRKIFQADELGVVLSRDL